MTRDCLDSFPKRRLVVGAGASGGVVCGSASFSPTNQTLVVELESQGKPCKAIMMSSYIHPESNERLGGFSSLTDVSSVELFLPMIPIPGGDHEITLGCSHGESCRSLFLCYGRGRSQVNSILIALETLLTQLGVSTSGALHGVSPRCFVLSWLEFVGWMTLLLQSYSSHIVWRHPAHWRQEAGFVLKFRCHCYARMTNWWSSDLRVRPEYKVSTPGGSVWASHLPPKLLSLAACV